jgi:dienelactone hydrolase
VVNLAVRIVKNAWNSIKPGKEARYGVIAALAATVLWAATVGALNLESGFGLGVDFAFALLLALIAVPLAALLVALVLILLRALKPLVAGLFAAAVAFLSLLWWGSSGYWIAAILVFTEACLGATLATFFLGGLRTASTAKKVVTGIICVMALAANVGIFSFFHADGVNVELIKSKIANLPPVLAVPNPSDRGPYAVQTLYYGSGDSLRRPEFGNSVAIKTRTVDGSGFFKDFTGWKSKLRKLYWGFGPGKLPLNGHIWYPNGPGPFPLVLMVHGNHEMTEPSDNGYAYLGELLASRGFIMVSVDENFLNSGLFHDPPKQQAVRGWLLLEHLKLWHEWNAQRGNPFYNKVDLANIALAGHSRGGEAAATAALFNTLAYYPDDASIRFHYGYKIKSVIAIAPADGQYKPAEQDRVIKDVNYFTLQGAYDADVSTFAGSRQWDRVQLTGAVPAFKSELYIYRANHGQFNTVWGRTDSSAPDNWLLNLRPLLTGDQQRQIAKVYISAFLEATLHKRESYVDLFRDYRRGRAWLPDTLYVNRYADQQQQTICKFDEDADLTTTTAPGGSISSSGLSIWREGKIPIRNGTRDYNGVFLGWNRQGEKKPAPSYIITLPPASNPPAGQLLLSIAVTDETAPKPGDKKPKDDEESSDIGSETTDFSIEASAGAGTAITLPLSRFATLLPPLDAQFTKWERLDKLIYKNASEPVFQTVAIPLDAFAIANIRRIRLVFDKTPERVILISFIGLGPSR